MECQRGRQERKQEGRETGSETGRKKEEREVEKRRVTETEIANLGDGKIVLFGNKLPTWNKCTSYY